MRELKPIHLVRGNVHIVPGAVALECFQHFIGLVYVGDLPAISAKSNRGESRASPTIENGCDAVFAKQAFKGTDVVVIPKESWVHPCRTQGSHESASSISSGGRLRSARVSPPRHDAYRMSVLFVTGGVTTGRIAPRLDTGW